MRSLSNRDEIGNNFYDDNKTLCVDVNGVLLIAMGLPGSNQNVFLRTEHQCASKGDTDGLPKSTMLSQRHCSLHNHVPLSLSLKCRLPLPHSFVAKTLLISCPWKHLEDWMQDTSVRISFPGAFLNDGGKMTTDARNFGEGQWQSCSTGQRWACLHHFSQEEWLSSTNIY